MRSACAPSSSSRSRGCVEPRAAETVNAKIATGEIEVTAREFRLLNEAKTPPFMIADEIEVTEETRLKHRYIDLRRPRMQRNMIMRHRATMAIRQYFDEQGFLEIETPMLAKSTPEGARDYLVPSRVHPGEFYALPQSPQIFKQILMIAGMDRYFQIARCFRDEDLRADRQPEFTQVDLEMSFATEDLVFSMLEPLMERLMALIGRGAPSPFLRLPYADAIAKYGSDKPDLRCGMAIADLSAAFAESPFTVFRDVIASGGQVRGFAVPGAAKYSRRELDELVAQAKQLGADGLVWARRGDSGIQSSALKAAGEAAIQQSLELAGAAAGDLVVMAAGAHAATSKLLGQLRLQIAKKENLLDPDNFAFLWVVDFPMFDWLEDEERCEFMHHPFTAPLESDRHLLETDQGARARGLRSRPQRQRDRRRQHPDSRPGAPAPHLHAARHLGRGGQGAVRLLRGRARVRHAAARGHRARPRPHRRDPVRRSLDPGRHRVSEDRAGGRPHGRGAVDGQREAVAGAEAQDRRRAQGLEVAEPGPNATDVRIANVISGLTRS